mmetsp:Transcript_21418/g.36537  ORF Transcript_21418/g.36537 Transcript_21418/m.36537 type:complete len:159 (+) Transcript_21418:125-601(+)
MAPQVGDKLPEVILYEGVPDAKVKLTDLFAGKKGILFGLPGAYTPGCSKTHLPGYVADFDKFKAAGADVIVCVATNDPFVMSAWGEAHAVGNKVRMLSDMDAKLTDAFGIALNILGSKRMSRFSAVISDNEIKAWNGEEGGAMSCSLSNPTLAQLKAL